MEIFPKKHIFAMFVLPCSKLNSVLVMTCCSPVTVIGADHSHSGTAQTCLLNTTTTTAWINVAVQPWAHSASPSEACFLSHLPLHTHKHTFNSHIPLARMSENVDYMWFWLATRSPHNGLTLTTSTLPL